MIGKSIWYFNDCRRVYTHDDGTKSLYPIWKKSWEEWHIIGETTRSWIVVPKSVKSIDHLFAKKVPKRGPAPGWSLTIEEINERAWLLDNKAQIASIVQRLQDPAVLRKVADVVGYEPK